MQRTIAGMISLACLAIGLHALPAGAQTQGVPGQEILFLMKDCAGAGLSTGCYESTPALDAVVWGLASPTNPVIVEIGPGDFDGTFSCSDGGNVTFRGAGRDRTRLTRFTSGGFVSPVLVTFDCDKIAFQDLTMIADEPFNLGYTVFWRGTGSSSWTDVDLIGDSAPWYDAGCGGSPTDPPTGQHFFWGSSFTGASFGFFAECGESFLYGSNVFVAPGKFGRPVNGNHVGVWPSFRGKVQLWGSSIEVTTAGAASGSGPIEGVRVGPGGNIGIPAGYGEFHSHGGSIRVDGSSLAGVQAIGMKVDKATSGDATAHALETAFAIKGGSGGGNVRLTGNGTFQAPFLWESGTAPPVAPLTSLTGQDLYVETDCTTTNCNSVGTVPRLMIYRSACTGANGPWWDARANACR